MFDLLLFAIFFALVFLIVLRESLGMLMLGVIGVFVAEFSHPALLALFSWWTASLGLALMLLFLVLGLWSVGNRGEHTSSFGAILVSVGVAGLMTTLLLPFVVSVFGSIPTSTYAPMLFQGALAKLAWTLGTFGTLVVASRMGR